MGKYPTYKLGPLVIFSCFSFFLSPGTWVERWLCRDNKQIAQGLHRNNSFCCLQHSTEWALYSPWYSTEYSIVAISLSLALSLSCWVNLTEGWCPYTQLHPSSPALSDCTRGINAWTLSSTLSNQLATPAGPWLHFQSFSDVHVDRATPAAGEVPWSSSKNLPINIYISLFNWLRYGKTGSGLTFGKAFCIL